MANLYPLGYGKDLVTMSQLRARHENHMEPEFARRLFNWIEAQGGLIGIGGGRRLEQPTKPGFAPPGMSFHQDQRYRDNTVWYSAVDLVARCPGAVHRAPTVAECPQQGSYGAKTWGVHINTYESWHMQAVELDGFQSWANAGRFRPKPDYPIPGTIPPIPPNEEDAEVKAVVIKGDGAPSYWAWSPAGVVGIPSLDWVQWGFEQGLYRNVDPVVFPQGEVDDLVAAQAER